MQISAHVAAAPMIWLFALGIIWFCLVHEGFRKLVFWLLGLGAAIFAVIVAVNFR